MSTLAIGSLAILLPFIATTNSEETTVTMEFGKVAEVLAILDESGSGAGFVLSILFLSFAFALGTIVVQFGELLALARDYRRGRQRIITRIEKVRENPALAPMYSSACSGFRSLCGFGGLLGLYAVASLWNAIVGLSLFWAMIAFSSAMLACFLTMWFARYSFTYFDWVISGELTE